MIIWCMSKVTQIKSDSAVHFVKKRFEYSIYKYHGF